MRTIKSRGLLLLTISALFGTPSPSWGQTAYVGASLMGDIVRTTHTDSSFVDGGETGGEAVGFALRVGTGLGSNWGVELEYARPSAISREQFIYPMFAIQAGLMPDVVPEIFPLPLPSETRDRNTTLSAVLWANQAVTERVSLVYLGGVAFNRFSREYGYAFDVLPALFSVSRTVTYSTRPVVGFESWIGLTDNVTLMPGLRLLGVEGGWSIRPAVGIGWSF